ncbi:MAG: Gfo/Idh/MocA family oxidoreductase [Nitrospira sp.]|nr:Gfo/Idh/MocA family oxidoreductase [Nitrospira sp.]
MVKLRAGVIGVGHLGQHHARLYASSPDSMLVGVVDHDHGRASVIAEQYGGRVFGDLQDLLKQVDVVTIAVPTSGHYPLAKTCLQAGKHVLIEKPIAVLPMEAQELVELGKHNGCTVQVGHSERFNPIMPLMRPYIGETVLFECHRLASYNERGVDVDVVLDLMIHDLDLLLSCNPGPIEDVRAVGVSVLSSTNDVANVRIQFQGGCVANLTASRSHRRPCDNGILSNPMGVCPSISTRDKVWSAVDRLSTTSSRWLRSKRFTLAMGNR